MTRRTKGEGSITQLTDGRWQARITLHQDGKTVRRAFYARTAAEARKKLTIAQRGNDEGLPLPSDRMTVAAYLKQWLENKQPDLRPESYRRYREACELHVIPEVGRKALTKLTPADVQTVYARARAKGLSGTSVQMIHGTLHTALRDAARQSLIVRNVVDLVDSPKRSTPEMSTLNHKEAEALLFAAKGDDYEAFYVIALTTGLRLGELLGLQWRQVDLDKGRLRVVATLSAVEGGEPVLTAPKTARSRREVRLSDMAVEALKAHRTRQIESRLLVAQHYADHDLVFANAFGRPLDANNLRERSFRKLLERAGLKPMRFHNLRHAAASLLLAEGVGIKQISELLGHADITVTLKVYAHLLPAAHDEAASAMDRMFGAR